MYIYHVFLWCGWDSGVKNTPVSAINPFFTSSRQYTETFEQSKGILGYVRFEIGQKNLPIVEKRVGLF